MFPITQHSHKLLILVVAAFAFSACRHMTEPQDTGWQYRNASTTSNLVISQFLDSKTGFVGGDGGAVLKTVDGGEHWNVIAHLAVSSESGNFVYGVHFADEMNGFATGDGYNIWRTVNGGSSWQQIPLNTNGQNFRCLTFASPMVGLAGTADAYSNPPGMNGELWRTVDGGTTWQMVKSISNGSFYNIQFTSATNGIATGKFGAAYYTVDGGLTWGAATTDVPFYQITHTTFLNATTAFASAMLINYTGAPPDSSCILRSDDAGHSWHTIYRTSYGVQGISSNGSTITAAGYAGSVLESKDGGATWSHSSLGDDRWLDVAYPDAHHTVMIGEKGHVVTRD